MRKEITNFYLIGAGGYGNQLSYMLKNNKIVKSIKFVDDQINLNIDSFFKIKKNICFNITIGLPKIRENIYLKSLRTKFTYTTLILPNKNIYSRNIEKGCIIEPNTVIVHNVQIGMGNFIFSGSVIGHDVVIGNFCNIGCNVVISGNVRFGNRVQVGSNSFISNNIVVCSDVIIAPGSVIIKDIKVSGTYKDNLRIK
jgi:UDP-3-O-[3-hydroxymyristoyl] glucosamine N-acyltransferase